MSYLAPPDSTVTVYTVDAPDGKQYSVRVYCDELTAHAGPDLLDRVVARIRPEYARRMEPYWKEHAAHDMLSALHTAALMGRGGQPTKRGLWE